MSSFVTRLCAPFGCRLSPLTAHRHRIAVALAATGIALLAGCASAPVAPTATAPATTTQTTATAHNTVRVVSSGGFTAAYQTLAPLYEQASQVQVQSAFGASMGTAPDSIPSRLARGERFDVVILADNALDKLIAEGKVVPGSRVDLGLSLIGAAVKKGTPKPDISSTAALKAALLSAKSIAYSASASGTYLSEKLFPQLGVWPQIQGKSTKIFSERVGAVVARAGAELGFQQASELLPFAELDYLGPIPDEVQQKVFFSAGVMADAPNPEGARRMIRFLASPAAAPIVRSTGLEPVARRQP